MVENRIKTAAKKWIESQSILQRSAKPFILKTFCSPEQKGGTQTRTGGKGFADLCLTTWLCRHLLSFVIVAVI
jgi:hypothetical protein